MIKKKAIQPKKKKKKKKKTKKQKKKKHKFANTPYISCERKTQK